MKIHAMGTGFRHESDFHIVRPNGSGDNLLVIFKTPAFAVADGKRVEVPADTAVLYGKNAPQDYGACGVEYINHWIHFECDENDIFFDSLGIVFNRPAPVAEVSAVESLLELLRIESLSDTAKSRECCALLLRLVIAQALAGSGGRSGNSHSGELKRLRAEIYGDPGKRFSINEMAEELSLSPSYFQTLYRSEFGVSCYEDVLRAKTGLAEYYLSGTSMTVREIAELCGFDNDVHFMRQFRKRTGKTALEYRRNAE